VPGEHIPNNRSFFVACLGEMHQYIPDLGIIDNIFCVRFNAKLVRKALFFPA
jgi:hypothetical protein